MPKYSELQSDDQVKYLTLLKEKALEKAKQTKPLAFDLQGRVLVQVLINENDINQAQPNAGAAPGSETAVWVSLDIIETDLEEDFWDKLASSLAAQNCDKKTKKDIIAALKLSPRNSINPLQSEYDFHLLTAMEIYYQAIPGLKQKRDEIEKAWQSARAKLQNFIQLTYAAALKKVFIKGRIDLATLNKELDAERKRLMPVAHKLLRHAIETECKVKLPKLTKKQLDDLSKETPATPCDMCHFDGRAGLAVWIEGSGTTAHTKDPQKFASRQISIHPFENGNVSPSLSRGAQVRVPSLSLTLDTAEQVADRLAGLSASYGMDKPFIYHLFLSVGQFSAEEWQNKANAAIRKMLSGAHLYNHRRSGTNPESFCFIFNSSVNGLGDDLTYDTKNDLVLETTLMGDIALLQALYSRMTPNGKSLVDDIKNSYKAYLSTPNRPSFFSDSLQGKEAIAKLQEIRKKPFSDNFLPETQQEAGIDASKHLPPLVLNISTCLAKLMHQGLSHQKKWAKLIHPLALFIEEYRLYGCKSAVDRTELIGGRELVLYSLLYNKGVDSQEQAALRQALETFAVNGQNPEALSQALDRAFNDSLKGATTLIPLADMGPIRAAIRGDGIVDQRHTVRFESTELTHLNQDNAGVMSAHNGDMVAQIVAACEEKVEQPGLQNQYIDAQKSASLLAQVGNYEINEAGDLLRDLKESVVKQDGSTEDVFVYNIVDRDFSDQEFIDKHLSADATKELYAGIDDYKKGHAEQVRKYCEQHPYEVDFDHLDDKFFRREWIRFCARTGFESYQKGVGEDVRLSTPKKAAIALTDLVKAQGRELFALALKEEESSVEYRNAVFRSSTVLVPGAKWLERPIIPLGGPSSSGKSRAFKQILRTLGLFLTKDKTDTSGNYVVSADGGEARDKNQVRAFALETAYKHGYTGVRDLQDQCKKTLENVKIYVRAAGLKSEMGVGIPETFSAGADVLDTVIKGIPNTKIIFARVKGAELKFFPEVVSHLGEGRAWLSEGFDKILLDLNVRKGMRESKGYGKGGFRFGKNRSRVAQDNYLDSETDPVGFLIINDLRLLVPLDDGLQEDDPKKRWRYAVPNEFPPGDKKVRIISQSGYEAWSKEDPVTRGSLKDFCEKRPIIIYTTAEYRLEKIREKFQEMINKLETKSGDAVSRQASLQSIGTFFRNLSSRSVGGNKLSDIADRKDLLEELLDIIPVRDDITETNSNSPINGEMRDDALQKLHEAIEKIKKYLADPKMKFLKEDLENLKIILIQRYKEIQVMHAARDDYNLADEREQAVGKWRGILRRQFLVVAEFEKSMTRTKTLQKSLSEVARLAGKHRAELAFLPPEIAQHLNTGDIGKNCDELIQTLEGHIDNVDHMLEKLDEDSLRLSLQGIGTMQDIKRNASPLDDLERHRAALVKSKEKAEEKLQKLRPATELIKQDLLSRIGDAAQETRTPMCDFSQMLIQEMPARELDGRVSYILPPQADDSRLMGTTEDTRYQYFTPVPENKAVDYVVRDSSTNKLIGIVTEENIVSKERGKVKRVIATEYPTNGTLQEKTLYVFFMAAKLLDGLDEAPTANQRLVLRGAQAEELKLLHDALVYLGKILPEMKFEPEALRIKSSHYYVKKQSLFQSLFQSLIPNGKSKDDSALPELHQATKKVVVEELQAFYRERLTANASQNPLLRSLASLGPSMSSLSI